MLLQNKCTYHRSRESKQICLSRAWMCCCGLEAGLKLYGPWYGDFCTWESGHVAFMHPYRLPRRIQFSLSIDGLVPLPSPPEPGSLTSYPIPPHSCLCPYLSNLATCRPNSPYDSLLIRRHLKNQRCIIQPFTFGSKWSHGGSSYE